MEKVKTLTGGRPLRVLISFTLPYLLAAFLQTFYGLADLLIVGRFCDTASVSAVSIGSQFMHMVTVVIIGLAMGATVKIGHLVGRGEIDGIDGVVRQVCTLFLILSVLFTILLLALDGPLVSLLQTPSEAAAGCRDYLFICFIGLPFICFYNVFCSIFRGLGDSASPMVFVFVACLINVGLDLLFVGSMGWGGAGAAVATVAAQAVSAALAFFYLRKKNFGFHVRPGISKPEKKPVLEILRLGGPVALQDGFIQVSFMIITMIANRRGLTFATGVGVTEKIISFLFLVPSAFLSSLSALTAQNTGAGKWKRARTTLYEALSICTVYGFLVFLLCQFEAPRLVALFSRDATVVAAGADYLRSYSIDTMFAGMHFCFSGYFTGIQKPTISFIHNLVSVLLIRIPGSWLASLLYPQSLYPMGWAAPLGSILSVIICVCFYIYLQKHPKNHFTIEEKPV